MTTLPSVIDWTTYFTPPTPQQPHILAVAYDLYREGQNYAVLTCKLEALGAIRIQQSLWWTAVTMEPLPFRQLLLPFADYNDSLMVMKVTSFAGHEMRPDIHAWIQRHAIAAGMTLTAA